MTKDSGVGYCRPPVSTRWPKGTSGNLAGRPKKRRMRYADILDEILGRELSITEKGVPRRITVLGAIIHRLMHKANAGNASAGRVLQRYLAHAKQIPNYEIVEPMDPQEAHAIYTKMIATSSDHDWE